ncbi:MAG: hypothetical protein CL581_00045 [Alteromonadaceae bacterium]|nr:hypothetical protein [Alteromonadaceae bacterium]|tara:strand:+ start:4587 stop:4859 length:273 start_codon:yes stop_codon:yes gene_type:complete
MMAGTAHTIFLKIAQASARCINPIAAAKIGDLIATPSILGETAGKTIATICNSPNAPAAKQATLKTRGMEPTRWKIVTVLTQLDLYSAQR